MDLVEFRLNLKNYNLRLEAFRLANNTGQKPVVSLAEIEETVADLFSGSTVESLETLISQSKAAAETEQKARQNLLEIAQLGFLKNQTREISKEIENCQNVVRVNFQDETLSIGQAQTKLAFEENAKARREIFVRLLEAKNSCADLPAERLAQTHEETKRLGFANLQKLFEKTTNLDFYDFSRKARGFLEKTEKLYFRHLSESVRKINLNEKSLHFADSVYLRRQFEHEKLFDAENLPRLYAKLLGDFSFSEYKVPNILLKQVSKNSQTKVFRPNPPEEVYLCFADRNGVSNYAEFLRAFGEANFAAWTSKNIANRFPEFIFSPDAVLADGYGFLFQTLPAEESFIRKSLNIGDEKMSAIIKRENEFWSLFEIRRAIVRFILEARIFSSGGSLQEASEQTAEIFSENLGFRCENQQMFWEISEDFSSLKTLRALLFAFGLREYLRERYDFDWWQKPKAFEELIDFWNAAERYKAEEMAQMIGFEMSFDLLAEQF